jgi:hypothetical protein
MAADFTDRREEEKRIRSDYADGWLWILPFPS